jgi:hypothetical protein
VPLIRHDVTGWEPIADQAAVIRHTGCEGPRRVRKLALVVEHPG